MDRSDGALFRLLPLGAALATRGAAADLRAAPRAAVELGLTRLLLAGTERHGIPRSDSLDSFGRCPLGNPPLRNDDASGTSRRIDGSSLLDPPALVPEILGTGDRGQSMVSRRRTRLPHWTAKIRATAEATTAPESNVPPRKTVSGTIRPQAIGNARTAGHCDANGRRNCQACRTSPITRNEGAPTEAMAKVSSQDAMMKRLAS